MEGWLIIPSKGYPLISSVNEEITIVFLTEPLPPGLEAASGKRIRAWGTIINHRADPNAQDLTGLFLNVEGWSLAPVSAAWQPASQPTDARTTERAKTLKASLDDFALGLDYDGEQGLENRYTTIVLTVGPPVVKDSPFHHVVQIDDKQAEKIIDHLAASGFLARAADVERATSSSPEGAGYSLRVHGINETVLYEDIGWGMGMLDRLDTLATVLDGDAARVMGRVLRRLDGHRKEWQKAGVPGFVPVDSPARLVKRHDEGTLTIAIRPRLYGSSMGCDMIETDQGATSQIYYCLQFQIDGRRYQVVWDVQYGGSNAPALQASKEYQFLLRPLQGSGDSVDIRCEVIKAWLDEKLILDRSAKQAPASRPATSVCSGAMGNG